MDEAPIYGMPFVSKLGFWGIFMKLMGAQWEHASLGTRPFVRGRRKGSGHHLTFELSPGRNVDLTNQKRWSRMTSGKWFSPGFLCRQWLDMANRCAVPRYPRATDKSRGEQRAGRLWSYVWYRSWSLITTHNYVPWGQLECRNVPRPFPPPPHKGSGSETRSMHVC